LIYLEPGLGTNSAGGREGHTPGPPAASALLARAGAAAVAVTALLPPAAAGAAANALTRPACCAARLRCRSASNSCGQIISVKGVRVCACSHVERYRNRCAEHCTTDANCCCSCCCSFAVNAVGVGMRMCEYLKRSPALQA
jgi:hypothetical protein